MKYIREKLADSFETEPRKIRIDQFNSRSYATVISIDNEDRKIRIHLDISLGNMIYISTLRILEEARVIE